MGFKIKWYCILAQFLYFSISWMQSAEELDYGGPQKYLLIKIVAKSASRDQKYASSANIKQFHFWKLQKNLTWQQIIFSYQKLHYTIHLHNLQRNASFMCWFKCLKWPKCNIFESVCQLFTPIIKVHILLVYKQEAWPPYSALTSDWVHISPQQQYIAFFS